MRLFIAICLSDEMRRALVSVQEQMRAQRVTARYTDPESLHLTLAFIGEYPEPDDVPLPELEPFPIALNGFGSFGDLWWAGIEPCEALGRYVRALRHELNAAGIPFDGKRFSPHITLARRATGRPAVTVPRVGMTVTHASLMRSDRGKHGMVYTELRRSSEDR